MSILLLKCHRRGSTASASIQSATISPNHESNSMKQSHIDIFAETSRLNLLPRSTLRNQNAPNPAEQKSCRVAVKRLPRPASHIVSPRRSNGLPQTDFKEANKQRHITFRRKSTFHKPKANIADETKIIHGEYERRHDFVKKGDGQRLKKCKISSTSHKQCCSRLEEERLKCYHPIPQTPSKQLFQKIPVYSPVVFRPETLIKENKFIRYVHSRVLNQIISRKEILQSVLILRDRIHLLSSSFGKEISQKQPIVLHDYKSLETALREFRLLKEHFKKLIGANQISNCNKLSIEPLSLSRQQVPSLKTIDKPIESQSSSMVRKSFDTKPSQPKRKRYSQISRGESLRYSTAQPIVDINSNSNGGIGLLQRTTALVFSRTQQLKPWQGKRHITEQSFDGECANESSSQQPLQQRQHSIKPNEQSPTAKITKREFDTLHEMCFEDEIFGTLSNIDGKKESDIVSIICSTKQLQLTSKAVRQFEELSSQRKHQTRKNTLKVNDEDARRTLQRKPTNRNAERRPSPPNTFAMKDRRRKQRARRPFECTQGVTSEPSGTSKSMSSEMDEVGNQNGNADDIDFFSLLGHLKPRRRITNLNNNKTSFVIDGEHFRQHQSGSEPKQDKDKPESNTGHRIRYLRINPKESFMKNRNLIYEECQKLKKYLEEDCPEISQLSQLLHRHLKTVVKSIIHTDECNNKSPSTRELQELILMIREGTTNNEHKKRRMLEFMQHFVKCKPPRRKDSESSERGQVEVEIDKFVPNKLAGKGKHSQLELKLLKLFLQLPRECQAETLQQSHLHDSGKMEECRVLRRLKHRRSDKSA